MMHFDIADVQLFLRIVSTGTLTQGAKEGARSTSAASTRLKSLESQLGARLFYREHSGLSLTTAGKEFHAHAKKINDDYEAARAAFKRKDGDKLGELRILANGASCYEIVPDIAASILAFSSSTKIDVRQRNPESAIRGVLDNEADIALVVGDVDCLGLNAIQFSIDYLCAVVGPDHPAAGLQTIDFRQVASHPMIASQGTTLDEFIKGKARQDGLSLNIRAAVQGFDPMFRLIKAGGGVALVPESVARRMSPTYGVFHTRLSDAWAYRERRVLFGAIDYLSNEAQLFLKILGEKFLDVGLSRANLPSYIEGARQGAAPV